MVKHVSMLTALLVALLAISGDAAKCSIKPAPAPAPGPAPAPAPATTTSAPSAPEATTKAPSVVPGPAPAPAPAPAVTTTPAAGEAGNSTAPAAGGAKTAGCGKDATIKTGTFTATVNGKERKYMVRVPTTYDSSKAYRVVFALHWRGGNMGDAAKIAGGYYGLEKLAAESTIFVAPEGLNAGWANSGGEDVKFIDEINKVLDAGLCVNPGLRFATGFSYGGMMSHALACARPDAFRGVAVLSGAAMSGCEGGTKPIAYMITHGLGDSVLPIAGARSMRDKFLKNNGCTAQEAAEPAKGSGTHTKTEYKGCSAGHPLVYYAFDGDHSATPKDKGGDEWTPKETWAFFSQFT